MILFVDIEKHLIRGLETHFRMCIVPGPRISHGIRYGN
jgi:hypothetical protein